ncbi:hypothetical protein QFC22_004187 [Naganishia vaughanmartiniae]|uniref:Uncharacterized protein n=1 Tax=Naganishia vaughanmartiniae TaxID=1424756 RepID=A0ACC2X4D1_9TREE|nr:hypothetical protein QFC22_004187 [Naganishia vaughanmartiniae]
MQREREATSGSQIATATHTPDNAGSGADEVNEIRVLKLRGGPILQRRVIWDEEVVDNEHLGRKSSKSTFFELGRFTSSQVDPVADVCVRLLVCCIYHKSRAFGESSSESDSSSSSSSSASDSDDDAPRPPPENDRPRGIGAGGRGMYPRDVDGKGKGKGKGKSSDEDGSESGMGSESDGGAGDGGARQVIPLSPPIHKSITNLLIPPFVH